MAGEYYIELRDFTTGARIAILTGATGSGADARNGFLRMGCHQQVNAPGLLEVEVPYDAPFLASLADKTQVLLKRRDPARSIDWYTEFVGLYRDPEYTSRNGRRTYTLRCPGLMSLLSWYHVLWPAATANRTLFTSAKAETIIKTLATYNATSSATTANGRDRTAPLYGIAVAADAAGGNTIDWTASRSKTLLEELQAIALIAGGDFSLAYTNSTTRTLNFHAGQLGTDRTSTVTFAESAGTMDNVRWTRVRSSERTAAIVGGVGEGAARSITTRTGTNYHATDNNIETFVDAKDLGEDGDTTAAREARGDKRLDELESRDSFSFDVVQTEGLYYRGSYVLGDLATAVKPDGTSTPVQIYTVDLDWRPNQKEQVAIGVRTR